MTEQNDSAEEYEDQDSEPTNTAPPGERPTDPEQTGRPTAPEGSLDAPPSS